MKKLVLFFKFIFIYCTRTVMQWPFKPKPGSVTATKGNQAMIARSDSKKPIPLFDRLVNWFCPFVLWIIFIHAMNHFQKEARIQHRSQQFKKKPEQAVSIWPAEKSSLKKFDTKEEFHEREQLAHKFSPILLLLEVKSG